MTIPSTFTPMWAFASGINTYYSWQGCPAATGAALTTCCTSTWECSSLPWAALDQSKTYKWKKPNFLALGQNDSSVRLNALVPRGATKGCPLWHFAPDNTLFGSHSSLVLLPPFLSWFPMRVSSVSYMNPHLRVSAREPGPWQHLRDAPICSLKHSSLCTHLKGKKSCTLNFHILKLTSKYLFMMS